MPESKLDEDLVDGLKEAKKTPRSFALIIKGASPVKLLVRKKKFKEGDLMKAKTEAKGNDYITGVLEASGSDFAFKIIANEEPGVTILKLKDLISEQAGMTAKPRWELVKELPKLPDDDDDTNKSGTQGTTSSTENASTQSAIPNAPPPPPPPPPPPQAPAVNANQLVAAMSKLGPQLQAAAKNNPDRVNDLTRPVAAFKEQIRLEQLDEARATLTQLVNLLKSLPTPTTQSSGNNQQAPKFSVMKLGKARIEWPDVRDKAVADIKKLKTALQEEFGQDGEQTQALTSALKKLDDLMVKLEVKLPDQLDAVLNADETSRGALITTARQTLNALNKLCDEDEVVAELDGNEVIEGFLVVQPMRSKLAEISAALG